MQQRTATFFTASFCKVLQVFCLLHCWVLEPAPWYAWPLFCLPPLASKRISSQLLRPSNPLQLVSLMWVQIQRASARSAPTIFQLNPLSLIYIKDLQTIMQSLPLSFLQIGFAIENNICLNSLINSSDCHSSSYEKIFLSSFYLNVTRGLRSYV